MENALEALETACVTILLALSIMVFVFFNKASRSGEESVVKGISREWLISEGER